MALTSAEDAVAEVSAQSTPASDDDLALSELSQADMQALAEKVMALLKHDLRLERERLLGR